MLRYGLKMLCGSNDELLHFRCVQPRVAHTFLILGGGKLDYNHWINKAVMQAYGLWDKFNTESECVAELMRMYKKLTE